MSVRLPEAGARQLKPAVAEEYQMHSHASWLGKATETVAALLSEMSSDPSGRFSPSVYETGRLVAITPSLERHAERVRFLLTEQRPDGRWGGPGDYDIVPTLSATDGLLAEAARPTATPAVAAAAERGLRALRNRLRPTGSLPDTVAVEIVVPSLVDSLNERLRLRGAAPLSTPRDTYGALLAGLRDAVARGHTVPDKLQHSLEVIGAPAQGAAFITPMAGGVVGCSPAATAVWLGDEQIREGSHPSIDYLRGVQDASGGVPVAAPLALFERSWVLSTLADAGIEFTAPAELVRSLHDAFDEDGAAGGLGLPPDADDTATALYALALLGSPRSPECLWAYQSGEHFSCFPEERTPSTSTNAHVLQAIGASLSGDLPGRERYARALTAVTGWLVEQQSADGTWQDKWHASPYYATVCCATALACYGGEAGSQAARTAVGWVLDSQRADGSWGRWEGTREETAYALRTLLRTGVARDDDAIERAAARGCAFLLAVDPGRRHPALWHDKDLYTPLRVVDTEIFAAQHLALSDPRIAALVAREETRIEAS